MKGLDELHRKLGNGLILTFFLCGWILVIVPLIHLMGTWAFLPWFLLYIVWFYFYDVYLLDAQFFSKIKRWNDGR